MIRIIGAAAFAIAASACATNQPEMASAAPQNKGMVTIAGIAPSQALGAVDTSKLVGAKAQAVTSNQPSATTESSATASGNAINVEGVTPAAVLAAIDPTRLVDNPKPIKPETTASGQSAAIQAEVKDGKYTTKDLTAAQNKAVREPG